MAEYGELKEQVTMLIKEKMRKSKITGLSIALVDGREVVWSEGFGYADLENKVAATAETTYPICSITKLFTGTAVMQLVDQGKLDIGKSVQEFIPEFSIKTRFPNAEPVSLRSLMTHHSGLPCDNRGHFLMKEWEDGFIGYRSAIDYLKGQYSAYPPEYIFSYSNLGVTLAGIAVESSSGIDYCDYVRENIFRPLKMSNSSFITDKGTREQMAKPYERNKYQEELPLRDLPAGGIVSNVLDMANFIKMVNLEGMPEDKKVLSKESLGQMLAVQNEDVPLDLGAKIGLNWILEWPSLDYAGKVCWHDGGSIHYNTILVILPEQKLGVVVLSNSTTAAMPIRDIAEETLHLALKAKNVNRPAVQNGRPEIIKMSESDMEEYEGTFASIMGIVTVKRAGHGLMLDLMGNKFIMVSHKDGWFSIKLKLFGVIPISLKQFKNMRISVLNINNEKIFAIGQKMGQSEIRQAIGREFAAKPIPETWKKLSGKYEALDKENSVMDSFDLTYKNCVLFIKTKVRKMGKLNLIISPITENEGVVEGLGRNAGETVFVKKENGRVSLSLIGLEFVKK